MFKGKLPPLEPLVAFEAAARLLSFTEAGKELNLTQAAISQQMRSLERRLGVRLFTREHRAVRLTPAGREYQHTVSTLLKHLASATADIRADIIRPRLSVATDQAVAALWLLPRLTLFQQDHPELGIRLVASDEDRDCTADDIAVAILHGAGDWPGFHAERLFGEEVFPVCSPAYASRVEQGCSVADLARESLLDLEDTHWDWMNWRLWLNSNGVELPTEHRRFQVNSYPLLIDAAKNGQGIALGWRHLVDDMLARGELVQPVQASVRTVFGYYLLSRERPAQLPEVELFRNWVKSAFTG